MATQVIDRELTVRLSIAAKSVDTLSSIPCPTSRASSEHRRGSDSITMNRIARVLLFIASNFALNSEDYSCMTSLSPSSSRRDCSSGLSAGDARWHREVLERIECTEPYVPA